MICRFIERMRRGLVPDIDVYDAAAWSAPGPLSEASVAKGSAPVKFPDFTRGLWKQKRLTWYLRIPGQYGNGYGGRWEIRAYLFRRSTKSFTMASQPACSSLLSAYCFC
jgi:hypothetical protein